ncbi:MAG: endonuclease MutS2, partial [Clostridia bacterium]|nr:endonuclease MutS2 [Clostridia bacterium]
MDKNQEKSLKKIEYNRIVDMLVSRCGFEPGRELARALLPLATRLEAEQGLAETSEGCELLRLYPTFSLGPIRDLRQCLQHVSIGGILTVEELLNVADCSRAARLTRSFFMTVKGNMPILIGLARGLAILKTIETAVEKAIDNEGKIADEASERLYSIRKKIKVSSERVRDRLENIIKNPDTAKYLQEPIVTMRDGRFVVPVRQECRSQIPGVAHDVSASGASVFIEPLAVVELNNDIQRLYRDEEEEVAAILRALTNVVAGFLDELQSNMLILAKLDFILAKAKLAASMNAVAPKINEKDFIHLKKARHPLISAERVVPTDIKLEKSQAAMIITGPNTGGKTVTLKTVGLLTQMALAGLHIPAEYGSELPFYHQVFADIGDEQSIEQSLSTFS